MIAFMGGQRSRPDVSLLDSLQQFGIVVSLFAAICSIYYFARQEATQKTWRTIWQHVPGWLVFVVLVLNSLVLIGELSYVLLASIDLPATDWRNHTALLCLLCSSLAFSLLYAAAHAANGAPPFDKGRW